MKQLITYFGLAYLISWIIWLPLFGHIFGLDLPTMPFQHAIGGLGPLIASFLTAWIYLRKEGLNSILVRCFQPKPLIYLAIAFFSPFILSLVALSINYFLNDTPIHLAGLVRSREFQELNFPIVFFYNLIFFGLGEEAGWRGFALPRLQQKYNALAASIIITVFWALWHLPLFFYRPGYTTMDMAGIAGWVFSLLTGSVLLTWLYNSSRGSILICAVFHSTVDIAFTADIADKKVVGYMGFLITVCGILIILMFKPRNLSDRPKETLAIR
jgi:membrane protease YdiL (CAAX protease family)